jgi:hypothetical protein
MAAAHAGVERVQGFGLGGGELEVEYVEVLGDPFGPCRLRDRGAAFLTSRRARINVATLRAEVGRNPTTRPCRT